MLRRLSAPTPASTPAPARGEVPAEVRAAALSAFALRDQEATVLDLLADTMVDAPTTGAPRRLWFLDVREGAEVCVRVRELAGSDLIALDVLTQSPARHVRVQSDAGTAALHEVSAGWWTSGRLRHGLMSVALDVEGDRLRTAWVRL